MSEQSPWPPRALPAGSRVADYRLDEQIGQGGMAVVYRAYDLPLERQVALKILDPALAQDEEFQQRFIRESRAAAAVDHPNIIPVFGAGQADGVLFIAMRFVGQRQCPDAADRLGPLPPRVAGIVAQVAAALDSAHHARPGAPGREARQHPARRGPGGRARRPRVPVRLRAQQAGAVLARSHRGRPADRHARLSGPGADHRRPGGRPGRPVRAGLRGFEMLAGSPPHRRDHRLAVLGAQLSQPPPLLTGIRPGLPPAVDQVMARALAEIPRMTATTGARTSPRRSARRWTRRAGRARRAGQTTLAGRPRPVAGPGGRVRAGRAAGPRPGPGRPRGRAARPRRAPGTRHATDPRAGWVSPPLGPEPPAGAGGGHRAAGHRAAGHRAAGHRRTQPRGPGGGRAWCPSCWPWWPSAWPGPCWPSRTAAGRPRWRWPHRAASPPPRPPPGWPACAPATSRWPGCRSRSP